MGDAGATARALAATVAPRAPGEGAALAAAANAGIAALDPDMRADLRLLDVVRDTLPGALIVGDSTQLTYAGNLGFAARRAGGWFNSATGFGTLGYGLPAAIGAALAEGAPVVAISGDGGLQFCLGELASAVEAKARVILLLHDNQGYGEIKSYMVRNNIPPLGVDILTPDLAAIAQACRWQVERVATPAALAQALGRAAQTEGPVMVIFGDDLRAAAQADL